MEENADPVYSRNVIEFVAVANEFCKYAEQASRLKGDELLKILQRILPLMYIKASLLPTLEPFFEDGNEKFVTESDWFSVRDLLRQRFGTADDYLEVFDDTKKGTELVQQVKSEFPGTRPAKNADGILDNITKQAEAKKIQATLVEGTKFPDFAEKDLSGKLFSVANYKGKVVLVDFWATWCGPCVHELPNVLRTYEKNHAKGFEILGISLDQEEKKLKDFTAQMKMPWQQYFDGKGWGNKLAVKYGVNSIPATYLLDGDGKIIGKDLRGDALLEAVTKALAKN